MKEFNIKDYLPLVRRPARYTGGEVNSVTKEISSEGPVALTFALAFPDVYEIGISHLGLQILYQILNARDDISAERVYAPWEDFEALLREKGEKLSTLENGLPLKECDIVGFTLQYELSYTNILNMLELGGIPLLASERVDDDPIVIGGGPTAFNAEPVADFFDAFLLGDGEEAVIEIADVLIQAKKDRATRAETLERLADIQGVYVPVFFEPVYNTDKTIKEVRALKKGYARIHKRIVADLKTLPDPVSPVVPFVEAIHDRLSVEIFRGCTRGCRFCHAGMVTRPVRERSPEDILRIIEEGLKNTGYDEVSLLSLSTGDYCSIEPLLSSLMERLVKERVAVSLPSLRVGTLGEGLMEEIKRVKKTGFTLAPEAGSDRLRKVINKGIEEAALLENARNIYALGWRSIKLYFMIGLPTETKEDIDAIVNLACRVRDVKVGGVYKGKRKGRGPAKNSPVSVSVGIFVPKPFTPFQWAPQIGLEESIDRQRSLKDKVEAAGLRLKWQDPHMSELEGVFSRGDRLLSKVVLGAFKKGARFDGWSDNFNRDFWDAAFDEAGIDKAFYNQRERGVMEVFPWAHLDAGVTDEFLRKEYESAKEGVECPDCKVDICTDCGVCDHKTIKNIVFKEEGIELVPSDDGAVEELSDESFRVRVNFSKTGPARFLSHLELKEAVNRAIRRASLPIKYSGGFHPMQKISFSDPTPVGMESFDEYMDIEFTRDISPSELLDSLKNELFEGIELIDASQISLQLPSLSASIKSTKYLIFIKNAPLDSEDIGIELDKLEGMLKDFCKAEAINLRVRRAQKDKVIDI
ncbi:MAG: TIGR03960 family B12-binding radical SAM protein, partial [Thermodesulfobacteriota bacterium]